MNNIHKLILLLICMIGGLLLTSCNGEEWTTGSNGQASGELAEQRQLVAHEVSVALDGVSSRVSYTSSGDGLQLSWDESETLGVYIEKTDNPIIYAGTVSSNGTAGSRGTRTFTGTVSEKSADERYIYVHPAPTGETQGQPAKGTIALDNQTGSLGSAAHLKNYIPLVWHEGSPIVENNGYAVHLSLTFKQNPGTITKVTLQAMENVGTFNIFPASFDASSMSASSTMNKEVSITVSGNATDKGNGTWTADAYIAAAHSNVDVFRTKFNAKVDAEHGTFYNEFRSFPGQEHANTNTGLTMLENGRCYNLATSLTNNIATTVINSTYKVNSLLGMWNEYGKATDPFGLIKSTGLPTQLTSNILGTDDLKTAFKDRMLKNASSQGSPTFTWDMVTKQCCGIYKQNNVTYNNIEIIDNPTEVYVTFISEYAWSQNLLGYYHYKTGNEPASSNDVLKTIIFPNVSKGGHVPYNKDGIDGGANINPNTAAANVSTAGDAPLAEYTTVQLLYNNPDGTFSKEFPAGTTIGFFIMRDPKASSSGHDEGITGGNDDIDHTGYQPRTDNTLLDWNSWRLFTNTAWNGASGNTGWWDSSCWNFFCSADVGNANNGGVIPGLALYGAKDDASHNYNYSFSAMLYMVSTSVPASLKTQNKAYFNIGEGSQVIAK